MIGGRRRKGTTYIDWQMNLKDFPAFSIRTAMRAYLTGARNRLRHPAADLRRRDAAPHESSVCSGKRD
jgi:hypothetical protein